MVKIFYVEDEPFLAKIVKESLETREYDVTQISDGANAKNAFESAEYDICILDIMLPNKSGYDIAIDIRKENSDIPILFLTAKDQTEDVVRGFGAGGNDYIRKPFSIEELIVRIENLLALSSKKFKEHEKPNEYSVGSQFIFYPDRLTLSSQYESIPLSHRESQILKHLCQTFPESVERKVILMEVWGDDSISNSRNLDVYITKLRGYLKSDPTVKIITLKGYGYKLTGIPK